MVLKSLHVYHLAYINVYEVVLLKKLCDKIIEKQKLRKEMMDLGLISTVMGPTGPTGATGPQGIQGEVGLKGDPGAEGPSFPASTKAMFYTSFIDTKEEGLLTILSPWLIPNPSDYFEVINDNEVLIKPGIYEITLSGLISGADDIHGGHFYLQDENGSEIKALSFNFPQSNGKYEHFYQTTLLRFESDTKLSVNTVILGDTYASSVEFSNVNLMIKRILYDL